MGFLAFLDLKLWL